jgi:hypothetical protein
MFAEASMAKIPVINVMRWIRVLSRPERIICVLAGIRLRAVMMLLKFVSMAFDSLMSDTDLTCLGQRE